MKTAVIPQVRAEPELRADLDAVRRAFAFRRVQTDFAARHQREEDFH
jgi:hypothetical protein